MSKQNETAAFIRRWAPSFAGVALYSVFALLWFYAPAGYAWLLNAADAMPQTPYPFNDLAAILQASVCWAQGVDVYSPSACMHGGIYNYSPFLLRAGILPFLPVNPGWGGVLLGLAFLAALGALPPARSRTELALRIISACSSSVIFALERANLDVAIFLLTLSGVALLLANRAAAWAGYVVFAFAAACKFYPVVLLSLILRARLAQFLAACVLGALAGGLFLIFFAHGTASAIRIIPIGMPFRGIFGARDISFGLVLLYFMPVATLTPDAAQYSASITHPIAVPILEMTAHLLSIAALFVGLKTMPFYRESFEKLEEKQSIFLVSGALVMTFCFFFAQNVHYRAIFLLLTLPGLFAMLAPASLRRRLQWMIFAVVFLLWEDGIRNAVMVVLNAVLPPNLAFYPELLFWLGSEVLWWWLIIQFIAMTFCFVFASLSRLRTEALSVL